MTSGSALGPLEGMPIIMLGVVGGVPNRVVGGGAVLVRGTSRERRPREAEDTLYQRSPTEPCGGTRLQAQFKEWSKRLCGASTLQGHKRPQATHKPRLTCCTATCVRAVQVPERVGLPYSVLVAPAGAGANMAPSVTAATGAPITGLPTLGYPALLAPGIPMGIGALPMPAEPVAPLKLVCGV